MANLVESEVILTPYNIGEDQLRVRRSGEDGGESSDENSKTKSTAELKAPILAPKGCTAGMWKELRPLVAIPPTSEAAVTNRLLKQTYSRLGRNLLFEAKPAVVHFGGYSLGKSYSQRVQVINISCTSQRLHILGPSTDCFKIRCRKKGLIAPGSSDTVAVDFYPREHRYHYDCVRLHTESDNLLIPLHAYPVMNDVVFPTRLDFGSHALGQTVSRTVKLECKVPIQFEFDIQVTKPHAHFHVEPLRGIVPANGAVKVYVQHTPSTSCTAEMELLVNVSQFNFKPVVCVITGSGRPGAVRQAELEAAASRLGGTILGDSLGRAGPGKYSNHLRARRKHQNDCNRDRVGAAGSETNASKPEGRARGRFIARSELTIEAGVMTKPRQGEFTGVLQEAVAVNELILDEIAASKRGDLVDTWATRPSEAEQHPYGTGTGSGAVFDVGGRWLASKRRSGDGASYERWEPPSEGRAFGSIVGPPSTRIVEGLSIPSRLDTVQATNFVLTQQPGKLKLKDLKEAIRRARADRERQLVEQEALRALTASDDEAKGQLEANVLSKPDVTSSPGIIDGNSVMRIGSGRECKRQQGTVCHLLDGLDRGDDLMEDSVRRGSLDINAYTGAGVDMVGGSRKQAKRKRQSAQLNVRLICTYERMVLGIATPSLPCGEAVGNGENSAATSKLKEMNFLHDLATTEAEERDRSFKVSVEHIGEPLLTTQEVKAALCERKRYQLITQRRRREEEKASIETCLKGPNEVGKRFARASLLLTGEGTHGVGFHHVPDWDIYKSDDWAKRRDVLRRLVKLVGKWIVRRRAARRLAAIQDRLKGLQSQEKVATMVERDNHEANLGTAIQSDASQDSWHSPGPSAGDITWEFPYPYVIPQALASKMVTEIKGETGVERVLGGPGAVSTRVSSAATMLSPPDFGLSAQDVHRYSFPIYEDGAITTRREEEVDENGPQTTFVDVDLFPLREPEEGRSMGYARVQPPGLNTYPSIETARTLRWSAFEEYGVRQPRDDEDDPSSEFIQDGGATACPGSNGWRQALSSTERTQSTATLGRRRSSVGLRMTPATTNNPEEAWLAEAEAELTAFAAEAEKVERIPNSLLRCPPPPQGVDLITPDPRFKPFLPELPMDEASPEWCLRLQAIHREVPVTKGMLLGYSPGSTTLRTYANAPRLSSVWRPQRERRASGLACMSGQASRGVWQPLKTASFERQIRSSNAVNNGVNGGRTAPEVSRYAARGAGRGFRLAPEAVAAAAVAGDDLSDSESDDGEGYAPRPTVDNARNVFDPEPEHEDDSSTKGDQDGAVGSAEGGARGSPFARDKALAALEDAIRVERDANAERLADRMGTIAAEVQNIKHAFVLQTPYHRIRSEEPQGG